MPHCQVQRLLCPRRPRLQGEDRAREIGRRGGEARHVDHRVHSTGDSDGGPDVLLDELELRGLAELLDVCEPAGREVVYTDNVIPPGMQRITQMRSDEPGSSGDDYSHLNHTPRIGKRPLPLRMTITHAGGCSKPDRARRDK